MDLALIPPDPAPEIARLAVQFRRANGPAIALANRLGGSLEAQLALLPPALRDRMNAAVAGALDLSFRAASHAPKAGPKGAMLAAVAAGAAGGAGGLATALAELPVTITVILQAIRREAVAAGFDPEDPAVRGECLRVFGAGSPLASDDGVDTSFISARLTLTGPALRTVIATVAPKLATALGQKLMAQAVPVMGAVTGAALNVAFLGYYTQVAQVRFALLRLAQQHGAEPVLAEFQRAMNTIDLRRVGR